MRLIDADALCEKIRKIYDGYMLDEGGCAPIDFENMVDDMPTAYDVEKVVEELEERKGNVFIDEKKMYQEDYFIDIDDAIGIVKAGGLK